MVLETEPDGTGNSLPDGIGNSVPDGGELQLCSTGVVSTRVVNEVTMGDKDNK